MERILEFKKALNKFKDVLSKPESEEIRDASIQRFEFTFELAWKAIQTFLRDKGILCRSPKDCIKEAFKYGLIDDEEIWLEMLEYRNLTAHTYQEEIAKEVYSRLKNYIEPFEKLLNKLLL